MAALPQTKTSPPILSGTALVLANRFQTPRLRMSVRDFRQEAANPFEGLLGLIGRDPGPGGRSAGHAQLTFNTTG